MKKIKVVYLSNLLNHYQLALSKGFVKLENVDYYFISTTTLTEERKKLKIPEYNHYDSWAVCALDSDKEKQRAYELFMDADIAIYGMVPKEFKYLLKDRHKAKKNVFHASERVYKKKPKLIEMPLRAILYFFRHTIHRNDYMLCASAFTAPDYRRTGNYKNKVFKWGYFSEFIEYKNFEFANKKNQNKFQICWVGRYLDWKHPESMIHLAKYLKNKNYNFIIKMVGVGELFDVIKQKVFDEKLTDCVEIIGSLPPEGVREIMLESHVFAFTSDRGEGWGVVLNEAMNSGCVVVGSNTIGSVPFLLNDGQNGIVFKSEDWNDMSSKIESLIHDKNKCHELSIAAYNTIRDIWNPDIAAKRFVNMAQSILCGKDTPYNDMGPCSRAPIIIPGVEK